jgi:hypothetical protein
MGATVEDEEAILALAQIRLSALLTEQAASEAAARFNERLGGRILEMLSMAEVQEFIRMFETGEAVGGAAAVATPASTGLGSSAAVFQPATAKTATPVIKLIYNEKLNFIE